MSHRGKRIQLESFLSREALHLLLCPGALDILPGTLTSEVPPEHVPNVSLEGCEVLEDRTSNTFFCHQDSCTHWANSRHIANAKKTNIRY